MEFAKSNGIHKCFETSAKTGKSVEEVFSVAGKNIFAKVMKDIKDESVAKEKIGTPLSDSRRRNNVA